MSLDDLKVFCENNKGKRFVFAKHSEVHPYWCVFAIEIENRKRHIVDSCFTNELTIENVFDLVMGYGEKIEISNKYMN